MNKHKSLFVVVTCMVLVFILSCSDSNKQAGEYIKSARDYISKNEPESAIIEYRNAIKLEPDNDIPHFELAETYILLQRLTPAIKYYRLALKLNPENLPAYLRLGQILTNLASNVTYP